MNLWRNEQQIRSSIHIECMVFLATQLGRPICVCLFLSRAEEGGSFGAAAAVVSCHSRHAKGAAGANPKDRLDRTHVFACMWLCLEQLR